jgi:hypothetical protein
MEQNIIIYNTPDGKASVSLFARDGSVWMNQNQIAELFATSVPNISMHISNILEEKELQPNSVIKDYLTTAKLKRGQIEKSKKTYLDFSGIVVENGKKYVEIRGPLVFE